MLLDRWFPDRHDLLEASALASLFPGIDIAYRSQVIPGYPESQAMMIERTARVTELLTTRYAGNQVWVGHGGSFTGIGQALAGQPCALHATTCCLARWRRSRGMLLGWR